jgi:hypothetical protein
MLKCAGVVRWRIRNPNNFRSRRQQHQLPAARRRARGPCGPDHGDARLAEPGSSFKLAPDCTSLGQGGRHQGVTEGIRQPAVTVTVTVVPPRPVVMVTVDASGQCRRRPMTVTVTGVST